MQPEIYRALDREGQVLHLDDQLVGNGALAQLPQVVRDAITIDGVIVKVPTAIHADAMLYYSRAVAAALSTYSLPCTTPATSFVPMSPV